MAISRVLYEGAKRTHACIVQSYPRVTRVQNACDTHAFVKLPLVGTVSECLLDIRVGLSYGQAGYKIWR